MEKGEAIKAKGDELIKRFRSKEAYGSDEMQFPKEHAVLCAIIAVEEIIKRLKDIRRFNYDAVDKQLNEEHEVLNYLKSKL